MDSGMKVTDKHHTQRISFDCHMPIANGGFKLNVSITGAIVTFSQNNDTINLPVEHIAELMTLIDKHIKVVQRDYFKEEENHDGQD